MKKYKEFINESRWRDRESFNFTNTIRSVFEGGLKFSSLASQKDGNPREDYIHMQEAMDGHGWTFTKIQNYVKNEFNNDQNLFKEHLESENLLEINGEIDFYLYKTFDRLGFDYDLIELGGSGWSEIKITEEEPFIKYSYGYHKTEYGKLYMKQIGMSDAELAELAVKYVVDELILTAKYDLIRILTGTQVEINIDEFFLKEEDRIIIYTDSLREHINEKFSENVKKDDIDAFFTKKLEEYPVKIAQTIDELVIYFTPD